AGRAALRALLGVCRSREPGGAAKPAVPPRVGGARRGVGSLVGRLGVGVVPERIPDHRGPGFFWTAVARGPRAAAFDDAPREGSVRAALRAQHPAGLGAD